MNVLYITADDADKADKPFLEDVFYQFQINLQLCYLSLHLENF